MSVWSNFELNWFHTPNQKYVPIPMSSSILVLQARFKPGFVYAEVYAFKIKKKRYLCSEGFALECIH